jgi:hypothetical protein
MAFIINFSIFFVLLEATALIIQKFGDGSEVAFYILIVSISILSSYFHDGLGYKKLYFYGLIAYDIFYFIPLSLYYLFDFEDM